MDWSIAARCKPHEHHDISKYACFSRFVIFSGGHVGTYAALCAFGILVTAPCIVAVDADFRFLGCPVGLLCEEFMTDRGFASRAARVFVYVSMRKTLLFACQAHRARLRLGARSKLRGLDCDVADATCERFAFDLFAICANHLLNLSREEFRNPLLFETMLVATYFAFRALDRLARPAFLFPFAEL
jgi:hypothetical protein